jgi:DNA-binding NarL/FixJ family response regulator
MPYSVSPPGIDTAVLDPCSPAGVASDRSVTHAEPAAIRIVIADGHQIFRDGLRRLLETVPDLRIVGDTDTSGALLMVQTLRPDILLLGWSASSLAPETLDETLAVDTGAVKVILIPRSIDDTVDAAVRLRAHGVLPKDTTADVLVASIRSVMAGHYWVGRERVTDLAAGVRRFGTATRRAQSFGLTRRELEIVRGVLSAETNREIAHRLSISENTVKRHLTHIFDKVGASTRVELALFATHHQLISAGHPSVLLSKNRTKEGAVL